ncbi:hypothetical protein AR687_24335 [Flavobacteriaceae bacterium CRH]|nr:hypothetical protein AR687_24335 [Flavobacteriaceae bacterium CRH]
MDAFYTASNIKIDGEEVNVMQTLMNDERELSVAKNGEKKYFYDEKGNIAKNLRSRYSFFNDYWYKSVILIIAKSHSITEWLLLL